MTSKSKLKALKKDELIEKVQGLEKEVEKQEKIAIATEKLHSGLVKKEAKAASDLKICKGKNGILLGDVSDLQADIEAKNDEIVEPVSCELNWIQSLFNWF